MRTRIVIKIIAVIDATFVIAKRKSEKIQACTEFELLTSAIPMQHFTNSANKTITSRSLNWLVLNLVNWLVLNLERNMMIIIIILQRV